MSLGSMMYAEDDSQGRLTGTLQTTPNGQQGDDDLNWLYGFGGSSQSYIRYGEDIRLPVHAEQR